MREKQVYYLFKRTMIAMSMLLLFSMLATIQLQANTVNETSLPQESKNVSGVVSDAMGTLPGVSVIVKGTSIGAATDVDGKYSFNVEADAVLVFSFIGYKTKEVIVGNQTTINVVMDEDTKLIDEVIVVGYATQKRVNLTGSVASVGPNQIKDRVQSDVLSAIQGTVPGVTVISRPGETPTINFRGRGNLGTSAPLYVIDGVISDAAFFSNLDPNSIESMSLLKDAASSAIYGSRAAYGVVLITTKQGKEGEFNVAYNSYVGVNMATYRPEYVDSWDYADLLNEANYNSNPSLGKNQSFSNEEIGWLKDGSKPDLYPNTQWNDLIYDKTAITTKHSVNFTGGSKKVRFFTGLGYTYNNEFLPNRDKNKYNLNLNISADVTNWLTIRTGVKYIQTNTSVESGTPTVSDALIAPSVFVAKHSNGDWGSVSAGKEVRYNNPLRILNNNNWSSGEYIKSMYELGVDIKPVKGLVITGQGSLKKAEDKYKSYTALTDPIMSFLNPAKEMPGSENTVNAMSMEWKSSPYITMTATALYNWNNDEHAITALLGTSYEDYSFKRLKAERNNFPADSFEDMSGGSTSGSGYKNESETQAWKMASYFARLNYILKDRYLFEVNVRTDGSSRFYEDSRWGIFPSFSAGWKMEEEEFMQGTSSWLRTLKLRASYGVLGNINNVGNYDYFPNYVPDANYSFKDEPVKGIYETKPANIGLTWETVTLSNVGVDFELFNGKLGGTIEYYIKDTEDILLDYEVAPEVGIAANKAPSQNIGKVRNQGFEFSIMHRNRIGDFSYSVSANFATNNNEIIDLNGSEIIKNVSGHGVAKYIMEEGSAIGSFYGFESDGLYSQSEIDNNQYYTYNSLIPNAGDIKYVPQRDIEYGQAINNDDRTIIGCDVPALTYGLNLNLQYKNFELSLFGQGVSGADVAFDVYQAHPFFHGADNPRKFHMDRWTEANPNPNAIYPRIYLTGDKHTAYNRTFSDYEVFDADYFRIKSLSLGYMVPKSTIEKIGLSSLKVFLTGENLFTFRADDEMKDFDPETAGGVVGTFGIKSVAFGLNVTF